MNLFERWACLRIASDLAQGVLEEEEEIYSLDLVEIRQG